MMLSSVLFPAAAASSDKPPINPLNTTFPAAAPVDEASWGTEVERRAATEPVELAETQL